MGTNHSEVPQGPIAIVPPDILLEIFDACRIAHEDDNEHTSSVHGLSVRAGPPAIAAVCQSWRDLAVHTPTLWTDVQIEFWSNNLTSATRLLNVILARSAELPLSISMRSFQDPSVTPDAAGPLVDALLEQSARWSRLDLCVSEEIFHLLLPAQGRLPQLRSLRSRILYCMTTRLDWAPFRGLFMDCPALVDVEHWGPKLDFPWEQLEEPIEVSSYDSHLWENVFHLERPQLRELSLRKVDRLRCVRAPNLTECHIQKDFFLPEDLGVLTNYVLAENLRLTSLTIAIKSTLAPELGELLSHCHALRQIQLKLLPISYGTEQSVCQNAAIFDGILSLLGVRRSRRVLLPALRHLGLMMINVLSADALASLVDIIQSRAAAPDDIATSLQSLTIHVCSSKADLRLTEGFSDLEVQLQSCRVEGMPAINIDRGVERGNYYRLRRIWREEWTTL